MNYATIKSHLQYTPEWKDPHKQRYIYRWKYIDVENNEFKRNNNIVIPLECGTGFYINKHNKYNVQFILPIYPYDGVVCAFMDISYEWALIKNKEEPNTKFQLNYTPLYEDIKTKVIYNTVSYKPSSIFDLIDTHEYIHCFKYILKSDIWSTIQIDKEYYKKDQTENPGTETPGTEIPITNV